MTAAPGRPGVSSALQAAYDEQYADATSEWREVGGKYKARNIVAVCQGRKFARVLDCGAGEGSVLKFLHETDAFSEFSAVEISASGISRIQARALPRLKEVRKFDGYEIPFADRAFDLAVCSHVIEHVEHPRILLRELRRVSAYQAFEIPLDYQIGVDRQVKHLLSYGHINVYTPSLFRFLLKSEGFEILSERLTHVADEVLAFIRRKEPAAKRSVAGTLRAGAAPLLGFGGRLLRGRRHHEEFDYAAYTCLAREAGELGIF
jgi:ubiquinone/menaquinone biosynthesis C-methylase UbiE